MPNFQIYWLTCDVSDRLSILPSVPNFQTLQVLWSSLTKQAEGRAQSLATRTPWVTRSTTLRGTLAAGRCWYINHVYTLNTNRNEHITQSIVYVQCHQIRGKLPSWIQSRPTKGFPTFLMLNMSVIWLHFYMVYFPVQTLRNALYLKCPLKNSYMLWELVPLHTITKPMSLSTINHS